MVHVIMEAEKSQDLQSAFWRLRNASASSRASGLETQEELMFHLESEGRDKSIPQLKEVRQEEVPCYWGVSPFVVFISSKDWDWLSPTTARNQSVLPAYKFKC